MTVILHFATALATIIIFRTDLKNVILGLIKFENNDSFWFSIKICISMVPAVVIGIF